MFRMFSGLTDSIARAVFSRQSGLSTRPQKYIELSPGGQSGLPAERGPVLWL